MLMNGGYDDDGFPAAKLFSQGYSCTYDDVIFLPHCIDFLTDAVSLYSLLSRNLTLFIPCVSSPMDTVTKSSMAAAIASLGAIGILHSNNTPSHQASLLRTAKSHGIPFSPDLISASPFDFIPSADQFGSTPCIFVTQSGASQYKLLGVVSFFTWEALPSADRKSLRVFDYLKKKENFAWSIIPQAINRIKEGVELSSQPVSSRSTPRAGYWIVEA